MIFKETMLSPLYLPRDLEKFPTTDQIMIHSYHARWEHFPILPLEVLTDAQNARQVCKVCKLSRQLHSKNDDMQ